MLIAAVLLRVSRYYSISCDTYAENGIKGRISYEINKNIETTITKQKNNTCDFIKIYYNNENKIESVSIDGAAINSFALNISNTVYDSIIDTENSFGFPIGNAFGSEFLSGKGPNVKVTVVPVGFVEYDIESEFVSAGINQTLYRIIINYKTKISCIAPFYDTESEIITKLIVCETLIVGEVPDFALPFVE